MTRRWDKNLNAIDFRSIDLSSFYNDDVVLRTYTRIRLLINKMLTQRRINNDLAFCAHISVRSTNLM